MMILKDDEVRKSLVDEFYDGEKSIDDLISIILKELLPLSLLRKKSEEESVGIRFNGLSIENIIEDYILSKLKLIENLERINKDLELELSEILEEIFQQINADFEFDDLLGITNGHDFIHYFRSICNKCRNPQVSEKHIAPCLRSSYDIRKFKKTALYSAITRTDLPLLTS
jgi:hypothetical protein